MRGGVPVAASGLGRGRQARVAGSSFGRARSHSKRETRLPSKMATSPSKVEPLSTKGRDAFAGFEAIEGRSVGLPHPRSQR
jgi:hypothetical protein